MNREATVVEGTIKTQVWNAIALQSMTQVFELLPTFCCYVSIAGDELQRTDRYLLFF